MSDYEFIEVSHADEGRIAIISMNRPKYRNAQNRGMLVEIDEAFAAAESDDQVRVVILQGNGPAFSSGHDLGSSDALRERESGPDQHPSYMCNGATRDGAESRMLQEWHYFFDNTRRWRNLRKITVASVHGPVYAGGLMLAWACDLIVAARGTTFADLVATRMGMCGVEYFAHPWEFGPRRAKELLLTGDSITAETAYEWGMVSKVFPEGELRDRTLEFAERIAKLPSMTSLMIKESVNQSQDFMGFSNALAAMFTIHSLNHTYWADLNESGIPVGTIESGFPAVKDAPPIVVSEMDKVRSERQI